MSKKEIVEVLSEIDHVLLRPNQYIGSKKKKSISTFIYENEKFKYKDITYIPALIKIICEILDNSIDVAIKTNFKKSNKIDIVIDSKSVSIKDNGTGIPVEKNKKFKKYMPMLAWTQLRAGSNFHDNKRKTRGMNGVGASCTNICSKYFKGETCDGKKNYVLECKDNLSKVKEKITNKKRSGTKVYFEPDFEFFGIDEIDETHINLVKQIIINNSIIYPKITFTFNKEKINYFKNNKDYISRFSSNYEFLENDKYLIAIFENKNDEIQYHTFVNGLFMLSGGNHIKLITNKISYELRDIINSKKKDFNLKPSDIRSKFSYIIFLNDFPDPEYTSQTKDSLENEEKDISDFISDIDFNSFAKKIYKNKSLIEPILLYGQVKNEMKALKEIEKKEKKNKKDSFSEKYIPANSKKRDKCSLYICEGDSASSPFLVCRESSDYQGMFPVRGKPKNVREVNMTTVYRNKELNEILKICNLSLIDLAVDYNWSKNFFIIHYPDIPKLIVNEKDKIKIDDKWLSVSLLSDEYKTPYKLKHKEFTIDSRYVKRKINKVNMNFGEGIKILSDADYDGYSIVGLFINFFTKYFPELFEAKLIKRIISPIVIGTNGKKIKRFYDLKEFEKEKSNYKDYKWKYYKGLGGLSEDEYKLILNKDEYCQVIEYSTIEDSEVVDMVYSKDKSDERKSWLMGEIDE